MSENKSFVHKLTSLLDPMPVLGKADLQTLHNLESKLDNLSQLLEKQPASTNGVSPVDFQTKIDELTEQVRKLAKTQFKTNTLQEKQLAQQQEALAALQTSSDGTETLVNQHQSAAVEVAKLELLKTLLPVMDSLDASFDIGRRQVLTLPLTPQVKKPIIAWLDGLRLARMRLSDVFTAHDVARIKAVGKPFDPHRHVAVATDSSTRVAEGTVLKVDREGYETSTKVLRESEVVVARST